MWFCCILLSIWSALAQTVPFGLTEQVLTREARRNFAA